MADAVAILDGRPVTAAEVDALVAEHVMGWSLGTLGFGCPPYSGTYEGMGKVLERLRDRLPSLVWCSGYVLGDARQLAWVAEFRRDADAGRWLGVAAAEAPVAVALAALLASGACRTAEAVRPGGAA